MRAFPMPQFDIRCIQDEFAKTSVLTSQFEYEYVRFLETIYDDVQHSFNNPRPIMFNKSVPDAYSKKAGKLFYAHGCGVRKNSFTTFFTKVKEMTVKIEFFIGSRAFY